jgi:hypothetical protein
MYDDDAKGTASINYAVLGSTVAFETLQAGRQAGRQLR